MIRSSLRTLLLFTAWVLAGSLSMAATSAARPGNAWTVMVYLDADNDLERPLMKNLEEMLKAARTEQVNVIVLAARHPEGNGKYSNAAVANLPNWSTVKLLRATSGKLQELADWGALDMGDPATLQRLVTTATQQYPATRYALIVGDHGMAWAGAAVAESMGDGDSLAIDEIAGALKDSLPAGARLDLIGFDACVMANLEVARTLAPTARYLVASEEIEPSDGWDYAALLTALTQSPDMDGKQLGRAVIDSYHDTYAKSVDRQRAEKAKGLTLSLIDLDLVAAVDKAVVALGSRIDAYLKRGGHSAWLQLARARSESEEYGRSATPSDEPPPGSEVFDAISVGENIRKFVKDPASVAAANALLAVTGPAVVYNRRGAARPHANGLSIFYPSNQVALATRGKTSYKETSFAASNTWYPYLRSYVDFPASPAERNRPRPSIDPIVSSGRMLSPNGKLNMATQVHADDIDEARFIISLVQDDQRVVIGSIPVDLKNDGDLKQEWDGQWFTISDNDNDFVAPITEFEEVSGDGNEDLYWAGVPARLRIAGTAAWVPVTLYFMLDFSDDSEEVSGDFIYAVEHTRNGPRELDLDEGDDLKPVYEVIDASGVSQRGVIGDNAEVIHIENDSDDLKVTRQRVPAGHYQVGFSVRDLAGRDSEQLADIEVRASDQADDSGDSQTAGENE